MFKSRFAREMHAFSSLTLDSLSIQPRSDSVDEDAEDEDEEEINEDESIWKNEEEWMDSNKFKKMLDHSEHQDEDAWIREDECWDGEPWDGEDQSCSGSTDIQTPDKRGTLSTDFTVQNPEQAKITGLFVNRLSDSVKMREVEGGEQNAGSEEIWERGGKKVSELSKIFEGLQGGSEKMSLQNSLPRPDSRGSSRPASAYSSIPPSEATCSRPSSIPPSSPPSRHSLRPKNSNSKVILGFSPKPAERKSLSTYSSFSKTNPNRPDDQMLRSSPHPPTRPVFKLAEPFTPRSQATQISKVETVLSLGLDQEVWQRKESSLELLEQEVRRLRGENQKLLQELELTSQSGARYLAMEKEIEDLHCQLNKMEDSRKVYERATTQLVSFLDQVSDQLVGSSSSRTTSRLSLEGLGSFPQPQFKSRSSLGADSLLSGGSRFSLGGGGGGGVGTPRFRNLHGSRLSLGLGARDLELARELDMVRELDVLRDLNVFRDLNGARDLTASRFSLTASDLNSRYRDARVDIPGRSINPGNKMANIPRSRSIMSIPVSDDEISTSRTRRRKTTRFMDSEIKLDGSEPPLQSTAVLDAITPVKSTPGKTSKKSREKRVKKSAGADLGGVWRREDGSEGGASLESKDSGRSTDSCSSGRSSPKGSKDRQQLASKAKRMVKAVRQFLAREKTRYPVEKKFTEPRNPWVLKEKENIPAWTKEDEMLQDAFLTGEDEKDGRPGRVVIRIRPDKERGILSSDRKPRVDQAPESTPRKSRSFSHSTPRTGGGNTPLKESLNENLIKITKMGTVTVPVPYPVISSSNEDLSTQWF